MADAQTTTLTIRRRLLRIRLNSAYSEDSTVLWPEMITLFATKRCKALGKAIGAAPPSIWLVLKWQQIGAIPGIP